jgi:DNA-binding PadR family transcriptional regulator
VYELIILALLMRGTTHGYVIGCVINDVIGPFARASNGRLYPLLTRLEEDGLVSVHEETTSEGGRVARSFSITLSGRERFRQLMLDTSSSPREYRDLFAFKVTAFDQIQPRERVQILEHYVEFARAHVRHLEQEAHDIDQASNYGHTAEHRARFAKVFRHLVAVWKREEEWATDMLREEAIAPGTTTHSARRATLTAQGKPAKRRKRP